jgi:Uma2 family endonuclease
MVAATRKRPATYEDVLAAPEHMVAEIIDGELILSPRPEPAHTVAASTIGANLLEPFQGGRGGPGGWWILDEPELHLEGSGRPIVPDVAGWRVERMPQLPDTAYFTVAPDWICEVISKGTEATDRAKKMPVYFDAGVRNIWLVNPVAQTLEVYRSAESVWQLMRTFSDEGTGATIRAEPFEAIEIDLARWWPKPVLPK